MLYVLAGIIGVLCGVFFHWTIPAAYSAYMGVAILAGLDSVFGGFAAILNKKFNMKIFLTGLVGNGLMAAGLVYIGKLINVDLTIAAVVVFGTRIFNNLATLRRFGVSKMENMKKKA